MNNDPSIPPATDFRERDCIANISTPWEEETIGRSFTEAELRERDVLKRHLQAEKKAELLGGLLRDLDIVVYAQLSALYYMDTSFVLFIVRILIQLVYLTPKPVFFPAPSKNHPYISAIFSVNAFTIIMHIIWRAPSAGAASRGYLHGGLFLDFVGEKGPINKYRLVAFDILVLVLQLIMLGVFVEWRKAKIRLESSTRSSRPSAQRRASSSGVASSTSTTLEGQDVRQPSDSNLGSEPHGSLPRIIQAIRSPYIQRPSPDLESGSNTTTDSRTPLLSPPAARTLSTSPSPSTYFATSRTPPHHPLDAFTSGIYVLVTIPLVTLLRERRIWSQEIGVDYPIPGAGGSALPRMNSYGPMATGFGIGVRTTQGQGDQEERRARERQRQRDRGVDVV